MTSLVFDNVSTVFASSTFYKDGFNPSTDKIQPGFKTPTTATVSTSAGIRTRILPLPTIVSLHSHLNTQQSPQLIKQSPPLRTPSATKVFLERMATIKSATTLITYPEHIPTSSASQQRTSVQIFSHVSTQQSSHSINSIKSSSPLHTPTATMSIFTSAEVLITNLEHIPVSSSFQQNTAVQMFSHVITQQSPRSITQSSPVQKPTATDIYRERMTTAKSAKTLSSSPEHIPLSSSFQQNTTLQMFSHFITQQLSQSIKQSCQLHTPTTIDVSLESVNILKSTKSLITKQEHIPTSSLPQRNNTVQMSASVKIQPTKTSQQQLMPSHSTNTKGNIKYIFKLFLFLISASLDTISARENKAKRLNVGLIPWVIPLIYF